MNWSEKAWSSIETINQHILELPFLREMMDGSLPIEKFYFYLRQDAIYLSEYGKILATISTKLEDAAQRTTFLHFAAETVAVESALHESYLQEAPSVDYEGASPSCLLYTGFLSKQLAFYPIETVLAAVLPCFWIYKMVGDYILEHQTKSENLYQSWIDTYGSEGFAESVRKAIAVCDDAAARAPHLQDAMTEAFIHASKMEWMFWDSAYRLEKWPI